MLAAAVGRSIREYIGMLGLSIRIWRSLRIDFNESRCARDNPQMFLLTKLIILGLLYIILVAESLLLFPQK